MNEKSVSVDVKLRLPDGESWFVLCTADNPDSAAEVVRSLCRPDVDKPVEILLQINRRCRPAS